MPSGRDTLMDPPIEDLLEHVDSKFTLVALGSMRARQVNSYYNSLGEGIGRVVPPQVTSVSGKPLSIAFEEVAAGKATYRRLDPEEEAALAQAAADAAAEAVAVESGASPLAVSEASALLGGTSADADAKAAAIADVAAVANVGAGGAVDSDDEGPAAS